MQKFGRGFLLLKEADGTRRGIKEGVLQIVFFHLKEALDIRLILDLIVLNRYLRK